MDGKRVYITPKAGVYFGEVQVILEKGNMWDVFGKTNLFLITTNPVQRQDGAVVMGRGIAKEAKEKFPQLPYDFGKHLQILKGEKYAFREPDFGVLGCYDGQPIGYFMVKSHWRNEADVDIIKKSALALYYMAHNYKRVDLNFPGIGNGKLKREDVLPIIEQLPDNVHVWEYSHMDQKEFWEG